MGLEDRDWYKREYQKKEKKYGPDFSKQGYHNPRQRNSSNKSGKESHYSGQRNNTDQGDSTAKKDFVEKTVFSNVFSPSGNYRTMRLGIDAEDERMMNVLGVCPKCLECFPVKVLKSQLYHYDYTCSNCNQVVTIKSKKVRKKGARIAMTILGILVVCIAVIFIGFIGNYAYFNWFPDIAVWFYKTFGYLR